MFSTSISGEPYYHKYLSLNHHHHKIYRIRYIPLDVVVLYA